MGPRNVPGRQPPSVGDRIASARRRRGMSRRVLADLIGRSEEWLRQIENGKRRLDSIEYAIRISDVLDIGDLLTELGLAEAHASRTSRPASAVARTRAAILSAVGTDLLGDEAQRRPQVVSLEREVEEAWRIWTGHANRYQRTFLLLPQLIQDASARLRTEVTADPIAAALSVHYLARTILSRVNEEQLAWIMADRALVAAGRVGGESLLAAAWHGASSYLRQGCYEEAQRLALAAAAHEPPGDARADNLLSLRGALLLVAAEAAAADLDVERCFQLLQDARRIARNVPDDLQPHMIPFGMTEVGISAVQSEIRLGRIAEAMRLAAEVDIPDDYPPDRQARFFIPLAFLHARRNEDAAAAFALGKIAGISPEDIRYDHLCGQALHRLLRRNNLTIRRELSRLAALSEFRPG
ncbi:helix-turn-helix domain-containing protein [Micromonospora sp. WMMD723]|uniref:helix-turn-helix domain-containing protein n=1 Tax=unclassified Micromonospora TaxID=2617518 RepID=UPI003B92C211